MKIEDVILALQCVAEDGECDCNACAYAEDGNPTPWYQCQKKAAGDAVELLKTQEPRVLKPEELAEWDGAFLLEDKFGKPELVWVSFYAEYDLYGNSNVRLLNLDGGVYDKSTLMYGYEWRCWSRRPTEEQLKAAEWDD